jgi:hypothetical protein
MMIAALGGHYATAVRFPSANVRCKLTALTERRGLREIPASAFDVQELVNEE